MNRREAIALALAGMLAMAAGVGIGRFVYTPILPEMKAALGFTSIEAGFLASANSLGYLAGALITALLGLRGDLRLWLLAALGVCGLTTMAMALSDSILLDSLLRFVGGVASALIIVGASALVLERLQGSPQDGMASVHFAGIGLGMAISALVVAIALALGADWALLWVVSGLVVLGVLPLVMRWVAPEMASAPQPAAKADSKGSNKALLLLILAYGLFAFGYIVMATFIVAMVKEDPTLAHAEVWVWLVVGLAAMPSVPLWTWVGRKIGDCTAFVVACLLLAAGVATSVLWRSEGGILFAAVILGSCYMGITALGLSAVKGLAGSRDREALGWMTASSGLGQTLGPTLAGLMIDLLGGYRDPILLAAFACLAAALLGAFAGLAREQAARA